MKTKLLNISGEVIEDSKISKIKCNTKLKNLVLTSTTLHEFQSTPTQSGQERIYIFFSSLGTIEMGKKEYSISPRDVILVPEGENHRIHNTFDEDMYYVCIFHDNNK
jgi:mannose-6-phosphate isomerase-like protein (cupin superfamily)